MKKLSSEKMCILGFAISFCLIYLWWFWLHLLVWYGIGSYLLAAVCAAACMVIGLYRPIPVKLRTVIMMYIGFYGIITDVLSIFLRNEPYVTLHRSGALVALLTAVSILYGYLNGLRTKRTYYRVPSPLSRTTRIALLSDIHMGKTVHEARLKKVLERIGAEKPDLLIIAGDLCDDETSREDMATAARLLGESGLPTYAVLGNHDLGFHGEKMHYSEEEFRRALSEAGVQLLDDEAVDLGAFTLVGRRDCWLEGRKDLRLFTLPRKPCIVVDHQPFDYQDALLRGVFLQLSGHTHAAQVFPLSVMGRWFRGFYGKCRRDSLTLITSCGLGNRGNRLRSGCTAEYVIIDLLSNGGN